MLPAVHRGLCLWVLLALAWPGFSGCRTARPLPVVDASQPGWSTQQFPALWRPPGRDAPEIAGDLFLTRHSEGRALIHFAKVPLPSVTAWRGAEAWQIEFQPRRRAAWGNGRPPARFLLLWVPEALSAGQVPPQLVVETPPGQNHLVRLRHRRTGETLTLFRQP